MTTFLARVLDALNAFTASLAGFSASIRSTRADPPRVPQRELARLTDFAARARTATDQLALSFTLIEQTGLDIVDMQVRVQGETTRLASALAALGETVDRQHFVREKFSAALVDLDERAQLVAAAAFPSAIEGLRAVNVKLWEFEPLQWKRYTDLLTSVVQRRKLTAPQQAKIQEIADGVRQGFSAINTLLNGLAEGTLGDGRTTRARVVEGRRMLTSALKQANSRMTDDYKAFQPIVNASTKIAGQVDKLLSELRIPVFPPHEELGALSDCIDLAEYESLSGVQRFALLNIASRIQATAPGGQPLLSAGHGIRVTRVFPDRIYLEAARSIIDAVRGDAGFSSAPASLHRFNEGSFKQRKFSKGNLQLSYASRPDGRVDVDADIDLYRAAVPHLFGEVFVNHLTGKTTDQFAVREILDDQSVDPIGGFEIVMV